MLHSVLQQFMGPGSEDWGADDIQVRPLHLEAQGRPLPNSSLFIAYPGPMAPVGPAQGLLHCCASARHLSAEACVASEGCSAQQYRIACHSGCLTAVQSCVRIRWQPRPGRASASNSAPQRAALWPMPLQALYSWYADQTGTAPVQATGLTAGQSASAAAGASGSGAPGATASRPEQGAAGSKEGTEAADKRQLRQRKAAATGALLCHNLRCHQLLPFGKRHVRSLAAWLPGCMALGCMCPFGCHQAAVSCSSTHNALPPSLPGTTCTQPPSLHKQKLL